MPKLPIDDKAEVEFVYLKVKGGSHALQEAVRGFATAITTRNTPSRHALPAPPPGRRVAAANDEQTAEQQPLFAHDVAEVEPEIAPEQIEVPRPSAPRVVKPRAIPEIIPDLDVTVGEVTLAEYVEKTQPQTVLDKYLVIVHWLREYKSIPSVTVNHIFTCYRGLKWIPPNDPSSPLRDLIKKQRQFLKGDGAGNYSLTILGQNEVERMSKSAA